MLHSVDIPYIKLMSTRNDTHTHLKWHRQRGCKRKQKRKKKCSQLDEQNGAIVKHIKIIVNALSHYWDTQSENWIDDVHFVFFVCIAKVYRFFENHGINYIPKHKIKNHGYNGFVCRVASVRKQTTIWPAWFMSQQKSLI